ncbi:MAG: hypothetical protein L6R41_007132 [Letrouitia leprolyta]|nr:MAG: hypothetical protein L6R41_007132 [Letrouitia leprolyta]
MSSSVPTSPVSQSAVPISLSYHLPYYSTTTTTITTKLYVTVNEVLHLSIPTPTSSVPTPYTTPPIPTSLEGKETPLGLPILVLTELDAILFGRELQHAISTATILQGTPGAPTPTQALIVPEYHRQGPFRDWSKIEIHGTMASIIISAIMISMSLLWCAYRRRAWAERGRKNRMRKRGRGWWRTDEDDRKKDPGAGKASSTRNLRERDDDEENALGKVGSKQTPKGTGGSSDARAKPAAVRGIWSDEVQSRAAQGLSRPKEVYQMSGARRDTPSPTLNLQDQPVSAASRNTQGGFLAPQPSSVGSRGTMSAYRAMREQQRREQETMSYLQIPGQHHRRSA